MFRSGFGNILKLSKCTQHPLSKRDMLTRICPFSVVKRNSLSQDVSINSKLANVMQTASIIGLLQANARHMLGYRLSDLAHTSAVLSNMSIMQFEKSQQALEQIISKVLL